MNGATHRGEPTVPTQKITDRDRIHLGLDVAKSSIAVAILRPDEVEPDTEKIAHDEASIRRLIARFDDPRQLVACYEAGPTGYELCRLSARSASAPTSSPPRSSQEQRETG
jgi:hypothetical protein